jgi:hypothetical protein
LPIAGIRTGAIAQVKHTIMDQRRLDRRSGWKPSAPADHTDRSIPGEAESVIVFVAAGIAVAGLGWVAGMLTFRRSLRWCAACGRMLRCPDCVGPVVHS